MAAARGPVAAMPGEGRATRARTSGFFTIGKVEKNQIRERLGHFLAKFSEIRNIQKNNSCFHVFFAAMPGDTAHFSIGFQLYRTLFYRISVVPHIFL